MLFTMNSSRVYLRWLNITKERLVTIQSWSFRSLKSWPRINSILKLPWHLLQPCNLQSSMQPQRAPGRNIWPASSWMCLTSEGMSLWSMESWITTWKDWTRIPRHSKMLLLCSPRRGAEVLPSSSLRAPPFPKVKVKGKGMHLHVGVAKKNVFSLVNASSGHAWRDGGRSKKRELPMQFSWLRGVLTGMRLRNLNFSSSKCYQWTKGMRPVRSPQDLFCWTVKVLTVHSIPRAIFATLWLPSIPLWYIQMEDKWCVHWRDIYLGLVGYISILKGLPTSSLWQWLSQEEEGSPMILRQEGFSTSTTLTLERLSVCISFTLHFMSMMLMPLSCNGFCWDGGEN